MYAQARLLLKKCPPLFFLAKWSHAKIRDTTARPRWAALAKQPTIKLELGSGAKRGTDGWTTVDIAHADINSDLCNGIPLLDASVDAIYSSHMFEHLSFNELLRLIGECKRVMKPGGTLSVCVPNAALYIRAYIEGREFERTHNQFLDAITETGSRIDQVNYIAYMSGAHKYMFDEENLVNTLKRGGFTDVTLRAFDPTLDTEHYRYVSVYALARN